MRRTIAESDWPARAMRSTNRPEGTISTREVDGAQLQQELLDALEASARPRLNSFTYAYAPAGRAAAHVPHAAACAVGGFGYADGLAADLSSMRLAAHGAHAAPPGAHANLRTHATRSRHARVRLPAPAAHHGAVRDALCGDRAGAPGVRAYPEAYLWRSVASQASAPQRPLAMHAQKTAAAVPPFDMKTCASL
jgi:hypothetical protein